MGTLRLVRHGQASFGAADYDVLSPRGVAQAEALGRSWAARGLGASAIYSGPLRRQRDTAAHLIRAAAAAGHRLPEVVIVDELAEYPAFELLARCLPQLVAARPELRGVVEGGQVDRAIGERALEAMVDAWCDGTLDTGDLETFDGFAARVARGLDAIVARHAGKGEVAVAVTSGGTIGVVGRLALGLDARATVGLWRLVRNASVSELLWRHRDGRRELSLLAWNHVDHLEPSLQTYR